MLAATAAYRCAGTTTSIATSSPGGTRSATAAELTPSEASSRPCATPVSRTRSRSATTAPALASVCGVRDSRVAGSNRATACGLSFREQGLARGAGVQREALADLVDRPQLVLAGRDHVDHAGPAAVLDSAADGLTEPVRKPAHVRVDRPPGCFRGHHRQPGELRPDPDPPRRRRADEQSLGGQRGHDPVHGGPGQVDPRGDLGEAQPKRLAFQCPQHLRRPRDDLHPAGPVGLPHRNRAYALLPAKTAGDTGRMEAMNDPFIQRTQEFFGIRAATWDTRFGHDVPAYAAAIAAAGIRPGGVAADVGCGTGRALPALRAAVGPDGRVIGLDLTPQMLAEARAKGWAGSGDLLVLADARQLPLASASVDAVFAAGLVNHLPDPRAGLAELARVTRTGGLLIVFHPVGRAALAARHGRAISPDEILSPVPLRRETAATGWELATHDDGADRFLAVAVRRGPYP